MEAGPWNSLANVRRVATRIRLGSLFQCFHCLNIWISLIAVTVAFGFNARTAILWFGVAGGGSVLFELLMGLKMTSFGKLPSGPPG